MINNYTKVNMQYSRKTFRTEVERRHIVDRTRFMSAHHIKGNVR